MNRDAVDFKEQLAHSRKLLENKQNEEAERILRGLVENEPDNAEALQEFARALSRLGRSDDAFETCERALALNPSLAMPHGIKGFLYIGQGKLDLAEQEIDKAIEINPSSSIDHANKGLILIRRRGHLEEAKQEFVEAVALDPSNAGLHYHLGIVLEKQSRYREALAEYHQAVTLDQNNAKAHLALGLMYSKANKQKWACFEYAQALRLDPTLKGARFSLITTRFRVPLTLVYALIVMGALFAPIKVSVPFFILFIALILLQLWLTVRSEQLEQAKTNMIILIIELTAYVFLHAFLWTQYRY